MTSERYYYGQGKVYLSPREQDGRPGPWRFIGDVSSLNVSLTFEQRVTKQSYKGVLAVDRRFIIEQGGTISSIWHSFSIDNLSLMVGSRLISEPPGLVEGLEINKGIKAGETFFLPHQGVWDFVIPGLDENIDYRFNGELGEVNFILTPTMPTIYASYKYAGGEPLPFYTEVKTEYALRYEGVNLAENEPPTVLEFYRLSLDPGTIIELINNGNELPGLVTNALILPDMAKVQDPLLGRFGRFIFIPVSDSTHGRLTPIYTTASTSGEIVTIYPK